MLLIKSIDLLETRTEAQTISKVQTLASVQTDVFAQKQSLALFHTNQNQTKAIAQAHAQAQVQVILDDLSLKLLSILIQYSVVAPSSLVSS